MTNKYEQRVNRLIDSVDSDLVLITEPINVFYFTGCFIDPHERLLALIIDSAAKETTLVFPALDQEVVNQSATVDHHLPHSDGADPFKLIFEKFEGKESVAVEGSHLTYDRYLNLLENFDRNHISRVDDAVNRLRGIKDSEDKEKLQEAVDITEKALNDMKEWGVIGRTEKEIAEFLVSQFKAYGAKDVSFGPIVLTGANSALPHGESGETKVQKGDYLLIDCGVITEDRYVSDMTRTFIIGEPTDEQRKIYNVVLEANKASIDQCRQGIAMNNLDKAARDIIDNAGYGEYFTHRIGHGVGIGLHELPSLDSSNKDSLEAGHVITIEPGIYQAGYGGVRIEDAVIVEEDGAPYNFNRFPKTIEEAILSK
jgi:Xaa-Pro dipeptidase